ncbi:MAG: hypothetical protein DRP09_16220 [Candidatus Thorarchaeota archaeon]|nr:MAG: hypothetical protein DRP09_16220 [Candidatus Thorarchaeota archaeon]
MMQVLDKVISEIAGRGERVKLTIDITNGFRYFPLLYFSAVSFLTTFRNVEVDRILYGNIAGENPGEIIDLSSAFSFIQWSQATHSFLKFGKVESLAQIVKEKLGQAVSSDHPDKTVSDIIKSLESMDHRISHALPLEIGSCATDFLEKLEVLNSSKSIVPPFTHIFNQIAQIIGPFAGKKISADKKQIRLSEEELEREIEIARWFFSSGRVGDTLLLLREYFVNMGLFAEGYEDWLEQGTRRHIEGKLGPLSRLCADERMAAHLTEKQLEMGQTWEKLSQLRNRYAHAGFKVEKTRSRKELMDVRDILEKCEVLEPIPLSLNSIHSRLLITPVGKSAGTLYSALKHTEPDYCIAITSKESVDLARQACREASFDEEKTRYITLKDPYEGYDELDEVRAQCLPDLHQAERVLFNLTGGTTLMGVIVHSMIREARRAGISSRTCVLIDKRSPQEQQDNPFVKSDIRWLEDLDS